MHGSKGSAHTDCRGRVTLRREPLCTTRSAVFATVLLTAACGVGKSTPAAIVDSGRNNLGANGYTLIDDMEGSPRQIKWPPPDGVSPGYWIASTDCAQLDDLSPSPKREFAELPTPQITMGEVRSSHAARLRSAMPLVNTWGAVMVINLNSTRAASVGSAVTSDASSDEEISEATAGSATSDASGDEEVSDGSATGDASGDEVVSDGSDGFLPLADVAEGGAKDGAASCSDGSALEDPGVPVDLSAYQGITFWAKAGAGAKSVLVQVRDVNTDPRGGACLDNDGGESACYNDFSFPLTLTDTFQRYTVRFAEMAQSPAWGYRPNPSINLGHVYAVLFEVKTPGGPCPVVGPCVGGPPSLTFDLWVDDLYFVNK